MQSSGLWARGWDILNIGKVPFYSVKSKVSVSANTGEMGCGNERFAPLDKEQLVKQRYLALRGRVSNMQLCEPSHLVLCIFPIRIRAYFRWRCFFAYSPFHPPDVAIPNTCDSAIPGYTIYPNTRKDIWRFWTICHPGSCL